jgi:hypothetical protein
MQLYTSCLPSEPQPFVGEQHAAPATLKFDLIAYTPVFGCVCAWALHDWRGHQSQEVCLVARERGGAAGDAVGIAVDPEELEGLSEAERQQLLQVGAPYDCFVENSGTLLCPAVSAGPSFPEGPG